MKLIMLCLSVGLFVTAIPGEAQQLIVAKSGTITAAGADCSVATRCVVMNDSLIGTAGSIGIDVQGTFTATLAFEATLDGVIYFSLRVIDQADGSEDTTTTTTGQWMASVVGYQAVRLRASAYTSGTATVTLRAPRGVASVMRTGSSAIGNKTNNAAAPGATNFGVLGCIANAANQTWTEGYLVGCSVDLSGGMRLQANSAFNVAQINGVTPLMGAGNTGTGSLRVTVASDQVAIPASQSGTWTVQPGNTANTTAWLIAGGKTNNAAAPLGTNIGSLGCLANAAAPTWTEGNLVLCSVDLSGGMRLVANSAVNVSQINGVAPTMGNGVSGTGVQRVTLASDSTGQVTLAAGAATIGALTANQSVNVAQVNGVTTTTGNGIAGTGVQRVAIASDNTAFAVNATLQTGANVIGALTANQSVNTAQINGVAPTMGNGVSGTGVQRVTLASDSTGQVTLATGSATIGALTANQSVNAAQIAGTATSTGNGVVGAGVQRVAIASDNTAFSVNATLATTDPCQTPGVAKSSVVINVTADAELIALTGGQTISVCGWAASVAGTTPTYRFIYGTGTTCATGLTGLTGVFAATTGSYTSYGGAGQTVMIAAVSNALCMDVEGTTPSVQGVLTYVKQ